MLNSSRHSLSSANAVSARHNVRLVGLLDDESILALFLTVKRLQSLKVQLTNSIS